MTKAQALHSGRSGSLGGAQPLLNQSWLRKSFADQRKMPRNTTSTETKAATLLLQTHHLCMSTALATASFGWVGSGAAMLQLGDSFLISPSLRFWLLRRKICQNAYRDNPSWQGWVTFRWQHWRSSGIQESHWSDGCRHSGAAPRQFWNKAALKERERLNRDTLAVFQGATLLAWQYVVDAKASCTKASLVELPSLPLLQT